MNYSALQNIAPGRGFGPASPYGQLLAVNPRLFLSVKDQLTGPDYHAYYDAKTEAATAKFKRKANYERRTPSPAAN